jgi:hypothetical protein
MRNFSRGAPPPPGSHSTNEVVIEYAIHEMLKGRSPETAAENTNKRLSGSANLFIKSGSEIVQIDTDELIAALYDRMLTSLLGSLAYYAPGKEHYALDGVLLEFNQIRLGQAPSPRAQQMRQRLKTTAIQVLGHNPFVYDNK